MISLVSISIEITEKSFIQVKWEPSHLCLHGIHKEKKSKSSKVLRKVSQLLLVTKSMLLLLVLMIIMKFSYGISNLESFSNPKRVEEMSLFLWNGWSKIPL